MVSIIIGETTMFQYYISKRANKVMVGYSAYSSRENYYADYVSYLVGLEQSDRPEKFEEFDFETMFHDGCRKGRFEQIHDCIESMKSHMELSDKNAFVSWIDADYWLFGLLYWVLFEGKTINFTPKLTETLNTAIMKVKSVDNNGYLKTPNLLTNLRSRLQASIELFKDYAQ